MPNNGGVKSSVTLSVSAEINNLRQIQEQLKTALQSGVNSNSGIFKALSNALEQVIAQTRRLTAESEKPFSSQKGIEKFNSDFVQTSNLTKRIANTMANLKFSELKIPPEALKGIENATASVQEAQAKLQALDTTKLAELAEKGNEITDVFSRAKVDITTDGLEKSLKKVSDLVVNTEKKISELTTKTETSKLIIGNLDTQNTELSDFEALLGSGRNTWYQNNTFGKFFNKNGTLIKNQNRDAESELQNKLREYGFDDQQVAKIIASIKGKAKEIAEARQEALDIINNKKTSNSSQREKERKNLSENEAAITTLTAEQEVNKSTKQELLDVKNSDDYKTAVEQLEAEVERLKQELNALKEATRADAEATKAGQKAYEGASANMSNFGKEVDNATDSLGKMQKAASNANSIKTAIANWMGFHQILNLGRRMIRNVIKDIQDLDKVMTEIAVVTNMTQKDLWAQMNTYQAIAREYAVSTQGVYQVSQIYYQQGLQTAEVMELTVETLKMAKIANLDYSKAADYMTVAIRGFHLEMDQASHIVDVYSKIAAVSASDTEELATAMSKTASSAAAVGSSFENTTAFIALMVETTRESAENIGSALKSIISRYGELKTSPDSLIDSEGEAMSFNKVETALQSVGISMHDVNGQFRDFDDVIIELSSKWDTLDMNTQRYIATVMAGNRQQSRFIALVSEYDRLSELVEEAANADDAATLQTLKTMDSLESKIQNLKNAWQGFYANLGLEEVFKKGLDFLTGIINRLNNMPKLLGKIPVVAITIITNAIKVIKGLATSFINYVVREVDRIRDALKNSFVKGASEGTDGAKKVVENKTLSSQVSAKAKAVGGTVGIAGRIASVAGTALTTGALAVGDDKAVTRGIMTGVGGLVSAAGNVAAGFATGGPYGALIAGLASIPNVLATVSSAFYDLTHAEELYLKALEEKIEKQKQEVLVANNEVKTYEQALEKLQVLSEHQYDSNEAREEFIEYQNSLIDQYPEILSYYDAEGNAVLRNANLYGLLAEKIQEAAEKDNERAKAAAEYAEKKRDKIISFSSDSNRAQISDSTIINALGLEPFIVGDQNIFPIRGDFDDETQTYTSTIPDLIKWLQEIQNEDFSKDVWQNGGDYRSALSAMLTAVDTSLQGYEGFKEIDWYDENKIPIPLTDIIPQYIDLLQGLDIEINNSVENYLRAKTEEKVTQIREKIADVLFTKLDTDSDDYLFLSTTLSSNFFSQLAQSHYDDVDNIDASAMIDLWTNTLTTIGQDGWKAAKRILSSPQEYSSQQVFMGALQEIFGEQFDEVDEYFLDYYQNVLSPEQILPKRQSTIKQNSGIINQLKEVQDKSIYAWAEVFDNESFLIGFQSRYYDLFSNWLGQIKQFSDNGQLDMAHNFSYLTRSIGVVARNNDELQSLLFTALLGVDFTNKESVENLITQINGMIDNATDEEDRTALTAIRDNIRTYSNSIYELLNTQIERITEKATKALSSYEEALKTGSKGFTDLSEISAIAAKFTDMSAIGENINSNAVFYFDKLEGAYFYTQTALDQLREKYYQSIYEEIDTIQTELNAATNELLSLDGTNIRWDASDAKTFFNLGESEELTPVQEQFYNWFKTQAVEEGKTYEEYVQAWIDELQARQTVLAEGADNLFDALQYQNALSNFPINDILAGTVESVTNWEYNIAQWLRLQYDDEASIEQYTQLLQDLNNGKAKAKDWTTLYKILKDAKVDDAYDKLLTSYTRDAAALASTLSSLSSLSLGSSIALNEEQITALFKAGYYKNAESLEEVLSGGLQTLTYGAEGFKDAISTLLNSASNALHAGELTLEEYNKQVTQFAAFDAEGWGATPIIDAFGKASSLTADAVADIVSSLGFTLSEDFDFTELKGITDYNGHQMVTDMQSFIYSLYTQASDSIKSFDDLEINWNDPRIVEAQSKLNEAFIQQQQAMLEAQTKQLSAIGSVKSGQQFLDLSYVWKGLDENAKKQLAQAVSNAGGRIGKDTGLLELGNASIFAIAEAIKNSGALDQTEEALAALEDAIISLLESLTDLLSKGLEGSLSNTEALDFSKMVSSRYGIKIDFTETEKGLKLSADSAEKLAQELYKAGTFQEKLAFKEYAKSLAGQAGTYKDIYSTMRKLKELETERAEKNGEVTEELRYQLALTREIAYAQMADTDSYNFMDFKMPSDFNGPANYWSSWETFMSKFREAKTNGYMEIEDFYNMVNAVNAVATEDNPITIFGTSLNGSLEQAADLIERGLGTIGQIDGKGAMITFKDMGDNIFSGMESFGTNVDKGIHEFAQSQIDMIDALIGFVQAMAIMEKMGDLDIDKSGFLSLDELFNSIIEVGVDSEEKVYTTLKDKARQVLKDIEANEEYQNALKSFSIDGHTGLEIIQGVLNDNKAMGKLLVDWYNLAAQMDYDITDIDSIYQSIKDGAIRLGKDTEFDFTIGEGDKQRTISIKQGVAIEYAKDTDGWKWITSDGKSYEAEQAAREHEVELIKQRTIDNWVKEQTIGELGDNNIFTVNGMTIELQVGDDGNITFNGYSSLAEALKEIIAREHPGRELDSVLAADFNARLEGDHLVELTYDQQQAIDTQASIDAAAKAADAVTEKMGELQASIDALNTTISQQETTISELQTKIGELQITNTEQDDRIQQLERALTIYQTGMGQIVESDKHWEHGVSDEASRGARDEYALIEEEEKAAAKARAARLAAQENQQEQDYQDMLIANAEAEAAAAAEAAAKAAADKAAHDAAEAAAAEVYEAALQEAALAQIIADEVAQKEEQSDFNQGQVWMSLLQHYAEEHPQPNWEDLNIASLPKYIQAILETEPDLISSLKGFMQAAYSDKKEFGVPLSPDEKDKAEQAQALQELIKQFVQTNPELYKRNDNRDDRIEGLAKFLSNLPEYAKYFDPEHLEFNIDESIAFIEQALKDAQTYARQFLAESDTSSGSTPLQSETTTHPQDELVDAVDAETEAQEDSNAALQEVIDAINQYLVDYTKQWQENTMPDENTTFDQFISDNRAPFAMPFSIPSDLLQSFYDTFGKKTGLLQTTFGDLKATIEWVNTTAGEACPQIRLLGEAVKESSKNMDKGRRDIQTASASIRSSLSVAASSLANGLNTIVKDVSNVADSLNNIKINLPQITGSNNSDASLGKNNATGSFGNALAGGTLMGELGPELWVSHGHYYVAGQNGAEFVNLPDDAIVFNHLQTERLLGKGKAGGHGKPVTNERKATSLATGNVHGGLAMASASDTLAQLKQLRAMWEAIAKMSVSDLGKKAGSGGGGGGGGSDDPTAFIGDLERWFSIEQEILKLEKDITKEQKIRAKLVGDQVAHGKQLYESYRREFDALTAEIDATQHLADLQQKWYEKRRTDLENSAVGEIFTFDENGVMKYEQYWDESKGSYSSGLDILASLYETDANGVSVFKNAGAQMDYLRSALGDGVNDIFAQLSDGSGNAIKANAKPEEFLQAWDDLVNSYKDELTDLYNQYNENQMKVYDLQNNQNEIIQEVIDNQLSLEQRVLTALIDKAQKAIDDLQDSRDALADANQKYIDGLNDSLQKQKDMYDRNEAANDLNKLQRQLAILQRSGGSASQIRSLQQQINDQMQDAYFTAQQDQISAIQEAADKQIERLDYQINLMTQTLEYQKENGLLWNEVYKIMTTWNAADISSFIADNTKALQGISSLDLKQQLIDVDTEIGIFKADWAEQVGQAVATSISQSRYHEPKKMEQPKDDGKNGSSSGTTTAPASTSKGGGGGGNGGNSGNNNSDKNNNTTKNYTLTIKYVCGNKKIKNDEVYPKPENTYINPFDYRRSIDGYIYSDIDPKNGIVLKKDTTITVKYKNKAKTTINSITSNSGNKSTLSLKDEGFANGGLVDYTGPAQVHGSKSKPESFFDAQSTAILRDDVLGSINVLDSLLADVSTAGTNSLNLGTSESLSIANPVININVDKIANDYDAKRAGQLAFDEMVKIARQSGNRSLSRR